MQMIVISVSSTVAIILVVLGVLAYVHDGAQAVKRRQQRKQRAADLFDSHRAGQDDRS
jgi:hypothetical protein